MTTYLREARENVRDPKEAAFIKNIVKKIKRVGPFTGNGFFDVEKKTVTSMIGHTVTYLIVLIQFKTAEL